MSTYNQFEFTSVDAKVPVRNEQSVSSPVRPVTSGLVSVLAGVRSAAVWLVRFRRTSFLGLPVYASPVSVTLALLVGLGVKVFLL